MDFVSFYVTFWKDFDNFCKWTGTQLLNLIYTSNQF
jgi:hypothetical protein